MWEAISNAAKVFAEKHLIPSIISLVAGLVTVLVLPENNLMIKKLNKVGVGILAFAICFLVIELIVFFVIKIRDRISLSKASKKYQIAREKEDIETLWENVDRLSPDERAILHKFLETNNKPIKRASSHFYSYDSLFSSDWVVSTTVPFQFENEDEGNNIIPPNIPPHRFYDDGATQYKLKDDFYEFLKYSKERYGKISNFE